MEKPKQSQLPNGKKTLGQLTLLELQNYYNNGLFVEARELLEYGSYLKGKLEMIKDSEDIGVVTKIRDDFDYLNSRMDIVSKQMINVKKVFELFAKIG